MAGYEEKRKKIIETLMGRPNGEEIQPENHQDYALNMLNYIRSLELIANGPLIGIATPTTQPVQPNDARACYLAGVAQDRTVTFQNFRNYLGQPIQITNGEMEACLVILIWDTQYWSAETVPTSIISQADQAYFYYNLTIRKTYPSVAAMNADINNPIGNDGKYIKVGEIVSVVNSTTPSENGIYSRTEDGWQFQSGMNFALVQETGTDPNVAMSQKAVTKIITEYNVSVQHPTSGLDGTNKYTLTGAIALIPVVLRSVGLKCSFLNVDGTMETWEYQGGTYDNTSSWMKRVNENYEDSIELVYTILDKDNKLLFGIEKDGSIHIPKGIPEDVKAALLNKVDSEEGMSLIASDVAKAISYYEQNEFIYTILDSNNKVLFGIKKDGSVYTPKGIPEEVNIELSNLENIKVDKEEGKTLINEKVEQSLLYEDSDEFIHTILDKDKKIVFGIRKDGSSYIPKGIPEDIKRVVGTYEDSEQYIYIIEDNEGRIIFGLDKDGKPFFPNRKMIEVKEDIEDRMSLLVDKDGKILSYRKKDGTLVETKMAIENLSLKNATFTSEFITQLSSDLKNSGFSSGTGDWSDTEKIELRMMSDDSHLINN